MNVKRLLLACFISMSTVSMFGQVSFGQPEKIADNWQFILDNEEEAKNANFDVSKWQTIDVPHDWSIKQQLSPTLASCTGFLPGGIGWYRKTLSIPENKKGEKVYLYFEGVYNRSEVYLNGHLLGKRPNGYVSFMYDATPYIDYGKENVITVRVDHSRYADSRWYTGSGIYRDVWVVYSNPTHIAQWGVYTYPSAVSKKQGTLNIEVEIENGKNGSANLSVQNELINKNGKTVAKVVNKINVQPNKNSKVESTLKVNNPDLWDLNNPNLYTLKTTVLENGKVIDHTSTTTGFRTFTFDPNKGFALNGVSMKMKGVCIHHDAGVLGSAVPREVWRDRLLTLKQIGCNAIRTSHNPQATALYELCDELGLLVMNEAYDEWEYPKRKWVEGWNVGTPAFDGSFDFFEEWGEKDLADIVRRDRNHLSVFAWSIGNEVDYPNDPYSHPVLDGGKETGFTQAMHGGYLKDAPDAMRLGGIAKRLVKVVKDFDKSRPTTAGLAGVAMSNETEYPGALDIAGYNYTESRYITDHEKYPNRVIYGSENRHDYDAWLAVKDNDHIFGQFLWTGIDYLGESGRWPSRGFYSGLIDFAGFIKPRGYYRQSLWSETPMIYIGTYKSANYLSQDAWATWNYNSGENIRVVCYTNGAKARLELNGQIVGQAKEYDNKTGIIHWDIPYADGKLEAVALDANNNEIARYAIQSSARSYALKVVGGETSISKDKGLSQVVIQVVDENGIPVVLSDDEVTCQIEGPAKLLGLEAGNNSDMSDYTDNTHRVFRGHIKAYIQSEGKQGTAKVSFSAPWLKSTEISIDIK